MIYTCQIEIKGEIKTAYIRATNEEDAYDKVKSFISRLEIEQNVTFDKPF